MSKQDEKDVVVDLAETNSDYYLANLLGTLKGKERIDQIKLAYTAATKHSDSRNLCAYLFMLLITYDEEILRYPMWLKFLDTRVYSCIELNPNSIEVIDYGDPNVVKRAKKISEWVAFVQSLNSELKTEHLLSKKIVYKVLANLLYVCDDESDQALESILLILSDEVHKKDDTLTKLLENALREQFQMPTDWEMLIKCYKWLCAQHDQFNYDLKKVFGLAWSHEMIHSDEGGAFGLSSILNVTQHLDKDNGRIVCEFLEKAAEQATKLAPIAKKLEEWLEARFCIVLSKTRFLVKIEARNSLLIEVYPHISETCWREQVSTMKKVIKDELLKNKDLVGTFSLVVINSETGIEEKTLSSFVS